MNAPKVTQKKRHGEGKNRSEAGTKNNCSESFQED